MPGSAAMIFNEFEKEGAHQRELENRESRDAFILAMSGVLSAALIALTGLIGGIILVANGYDAGYVVSLLGVGAIVGALVYGTRNQRTGD